VQDRGVARLWGSFSYFLATRSSQMNAEVTSDVDPNVCMYVCRFVTRSPYSLSSHEARKY